MDTDPATLATTAAAAAGSVMVASPDLDALLDRPIARCVNRYRAASLDQLHTVLRHDPAGRTAGSGPPARCLDLIGHSTSGHHLLRLGDTPIDMLNPFVAGFFHNLWTSGTLTQLNVAAVRLLGCQTATTDAGRRTIRMLSRTLRMPVYGTLVPLLNGHYTEAGFNPAFAHQLVDATALT
jgi:hypothetical protein